MLAGERDEAVFAGSTAGHARPGQATHCGPSVGTPPKDVPDHAGRSRQPGAGHVDGMTTTDGPVRDSSDALRSAANAHDTAADRLRHTR